MDKDRPIVEEKQEQEEETISLQEEEEVLSYSRVSLFSELPNIITVSPQTKTTKPKATVVAKPKATVVMSRFTDKPVSLSTVNTEYCLHPPDKRTPDTKVKTMKLATEALPATFKEVGYAFTDENSDALLMAGYTMYMRSTDVWKRLVKFGMNEVFMIPEDADDWVDKTNSELDGLMVTRRNLTEEWHSITEAQVCASTVFYQRRGQDYDKENLYWSLELLEKSCDPELREKITELCDEAADEERGGPLFYWHLMHCLSTCTEEASRMLCKVVRDLDPRKIPGEDINKACSMIRGALIRLRVAGPQGTSLIPSDIVLSLLDVFQRTSVEPFNKMFEALGFNRALGIMATTVDTKYILKLAENKYSELKGTSLWTGAGLPDSLFPTQETTTEGAGRTCWNCNEPGHMARDCPRPRNGGGRGGIEEEEEQDELDENEVLPGGVPPRHKVSHSSRRKAASPTSGVLPADVGSRVPGCTLPRSIVLEDDPPTKLTSRQGPG
jgi:hypothetical protein